MTKHGCPDTVPIGRDELLIAEAVPFERYDFVAAIHWAVLDCLKYLQQIDYSDQTEESRRGNYAAYLATWLLEDPRVLDFFPNGLPSGPAYREVRGNVEAVVTERCGYPLDSARNDSEFRITLWQGGAGENQGGAWRRDSLTVADIPLASATMESCRAWVAQECVRRRSGDRR